MSFDEEAIKKAWVKRVKELMPQKGFKTYQDLSSEAGISAGSLNQAMRGMHLPRQTTIDKIATALGTTSQFLLYGDNMKVANTVPFLTNAWSIYHQFYGNDHELEDVNFVEVDSTLNLGRKAFAWTVDQHDMHPVFQAGDLLIFDVEHVEDRHHFVKRKPSYMLALELDKMKSPIRTIFGQAFLSSTGLYLSNNDEKCPYCKLEEHHKLVGWVVQLIRTFI